MNTNANIRIPVDLTNPGQFFACCGLLELADRLWPGAEGWFEPQDFCMTCGGSPRALMQRTAEAELIQLEPENKKSSPIEIGAPFRPVRLDGWRDVRAGGN